MMRVAIKTAIKYTENIMNDFKDCDNIDVLAITDNKVEKWDTVFCGVKILSPFQCMKMYQERKIDAVVIPSVLGYNRIQEIGKELRSFGYRMEDIYVSNVLRSDMEADERGSLIKFEEYCALDYMEFHVAHKCNLNCKSCCHFSSITTREFPDFYEWQTGMEQLQKKIVHINNIHLLGGEPLLNPDLNRYVEETRKLFPESKIEIISNGILVRQMTKELIDCLKKHNVKIGITVYPALYKNMEEILKYLENLDLLSGVGYAFEFSKMLSKERRPFPYSSTEKICHCPNLDGTNLAPCPLIAYISDFNDKFHEDFEYEDGLVSLLNEKMTGKQLLEELYRPKKLCDFCRSYMTEGAIRGRNDWSSKWAVYDKDHAAQSSDWLLEN